MHSKYPDTDIPCHQFNGYCSECSLRNTTECDLKRWAKQEEDFCADRGEDIYPLGACPKCGCLKTKDMAIEEHSDIACGPEVCVKRCAECDAIVDYWV